MKTKGIVVVLVGIMSFAILASEKKGNYKAPASIEETKILIDFRNVNKSVTNLLNKTKNLSKVRAQQEKF